ncbi:hypothetical protein CKM354_001299500 [Cercospora kikuchii]|uniref:3beta-hydroxysteroid 3-dehydrogenase n=1 Tax=Cercospora kikuchii TaxID=84275 RepID=A0A9P3FN92_9PEZI|nr:uncharacterized protein CKM354_001299500 [Cercospora kikuchii]GIZ49980.1 hypothetical protein CKM354_001299500 [Cercospora kikuchii]
MVPGITPRQTGTILLTGASGGLSRGFIQQLFESNHCEELFGLYTTRDPSFCPDLVRLLDSAPAGHHYALEQLDLSSLDNVRKFAASVKARVASGFLPPIRAILINATVWQADGQKFSVDGLEMNFAANYLAHFLLVLLLLGSMDRECGRIVVTSSAAHDPYGPYSKTFVTEEEHKTVFRNTEILARPELDTPGDEARAGVRRYGMSKTLLIMFMFELQRRLDRDPNLSGISILALDPGTMGGTGLVRSGSLVIRLMMNYILPPITQVAGWYSPNGMLRTPYKSGGDLLRAAFDESDIGRHPKALYLDGSAVGQPAEEAKDEDKQRRLWEGSVKLAGLRQEETALTGLG